MAEVINLRLRRKQASRDAQRQAGTENAARHGQSRPEKALHKARADKAARDLDAHKRDKG